MLTFMSDQSSEWTICRECAPELVMTLIVRAKQESTREGEL